VNPEGKRPPLYVDVRIGSTIRISCADADRNIRMSVEAHILALGNAEAANQFFVPASALVDGQKVVDVLRAEVSGAEKRMPRGAPGSG
jgi:hypothetical protein